MSTGTSLTISRSSSVKSIFPFKKQAGLLHALLGLSVQRPTPKAGVSHLPNENSTNAFNELSRWQGAITNIFHDDPLSYVPWDPIRTLSAWVVWSQLVLDSA